MTAAVVVAFALGAGAAGFAGLVAIVWREMERERKEIPFSRINIRRM